MDISVLLATYKRAEILLQTLESFCLLNTGTLEWEILVVDNADDERTRQLIEKYRDKLPIRYLLETKRGKNNALNKAIPGAKGTLIVFTDDDIIAERNWLFEMWEGAKRWPDCSIFGGRILPKFPPGKIPIPREHPFFSGAYAVLDLKRDEGPYRAQDVWGSNMAIRSEVFHRGWRFNPAIGPKGDNYIMGSETELTKRLEKAGFHSIYLPRSLVYHQIRPEQMKLEWIYGRAFRSGRSQAQQYGYPNVPYLFGVPRPLVRELIQLGMEKILHSLDRYKAIDSGIEYWIARGKFYQYRKGLIKETGEFSK